MDLALPPPDDAHEPCEQWLKRIADEAQESIALSSIAPGTAADTMVRIDIVLKVLEAMKDLVKERVLAGERAEFGGKVFGPITAKGRAKVDMAAMGEAGVLDRYTELVEVVKGLEAKYSKRGTDEVRWTWHKDGGGAE